MNAGMLILVMLGFGATLALIQHNPDKLDSLALKLMALASRLSLLASRIRFQREKNLQIKREWESYSKVRLHEIRVQFGLETASVEFEREA